VTTRDPLSAIPVAAEDTSLQASSARGALLVRRERRAGGIGAWLARRLRFQPQRFYELDELGACFWAEVDGQRRLSDIRDTLCRRYALSPEDARRAVIEFTAALMRRNLLALRVEEP
jgi:hypothetical protein